jgi:arginyl-tRNA synthetase
MTVSPFSVVLDEAAEAIEGAAASLGYKTGNVRGAMSASKGFGDISCSVAFRISKSAGEQPADIAAKIASRIGKCRLIEEAAAEGGYINMSVKRADFASLVLRSISEAAYGTGLSGIGNGKKVIIEYPSANPMHPIHVGHLRNLLLGDAVSNLHRLCGYDVEVEDYIDDLGLQMVIAVWGYMRHKEKP